jgi:hypothetical protein
MATVPPVVRYLVVCEDCRIDPINPRKISAIHLVGAVNPPHGKNYPVALKEVVGVCMLTEGRGSVRFRLEIAKDFDPPIYQSADQATTFGPDPLQMVVLTFRVRNLLIPGPGVYEFRLVCDDAVLAVQYVRAR